MSVAIARSRSGYATGRRRPACRARVGRVLALLSVLLTSSAPAVAEEGVYIGKLVGGAATVHPDMPKPGGVMAGSVDVGWTDAVSVIFGTTFVLHGTYTTLGFGAGLKLIPLQSMWARFYLHVAPQFLLFWDRTGGRGEPVHPDLAVYGGLGFEYLVMWGFGFAIEVNGTLPAGLTGRGGPLEGASVGVLAGLFMEL